MRRRNYEVNVIEILMAIGVIVLAVILVFKSSELTILYPVTFGLAALLSLLHAFEGILYNKNRVIKKSRLVVYILLAIVLAGIAFISYRVVRS